MGMRQRLGVARCLLADPLLLILDEPMNGLDPAGIQEFREMVADLVQEGRTVFLSSHLLDEVEKTCEQVAIIDQGRILMQGPIADIGRTGRPTIRIRCGDPDAAADDPAIDPRRAARDERERSAPGRSGTGARRGRQTPLVAEMKRRLVAAPCPSTPSSPSGSRWRSGSWR